MKTLQPALVTGPGRPRVVPGAILGRPRRAQSGCESSKKVSGTVPRRSRTVPEQGPSEFGAASCVAHVSGAIRCRFYAVARKPRYAFRISFYNVLLASSDLGHKRMRAAKRFENQRVSASKIEPRSVRASQNRARAARFEQQNTKSRTIFLLSARTSQSVRQSERESASCWAGKGR